MSRRPLTLQLYALTAAALEPLTPWLLRRRARRGKEDPARMGERRGFAGRPRPEGPLIWLHGASVGEALSMVPLIERLRAERPDAIVLATTGTRTAAEVLASRLPPEAIHQFVPLDTPQAAARFMAHWRPGLAIFVESELWPNLLAAATTSGARLALASARITAKSARGWSRAPGAARAVIGAFDLILAQDAASSERILAMGGRVDGLLNLKDDATPLPVNEAALTALRGQVGDRAVVVAASTHPGEERLMADAVAALERAPLLVIAPRHPARGEEIVGALRDIKVARRSRGEVIGADTAVYLADTLGELGLSYRLADVCVMGGSLTVGGGGHNPLEPARLGATIISGRHVANFQGVYAAMTDAGAAVTVDGPAELSAVLARLLVDSEVRARLGAAALAFAEARHGDFETAWLKLKTLMPT